MSDGTLGAAAESKISLEYLNMGLESSMPATQEIQIPLSYGNILSVITNGSMLQAGLKCLTLCENSMSDTGKRKLPSAGSAVSPAGVDETLL